MEKPDDLIPIPAKQIMNPGLTAATESTMLDVFKKPGELNADCSSAYDSFKKKLVFEVSVGPFKVSGLGYAVESLKLIFAQIKIDLPEIYTAIKSAGLLCIRSRRHNPSKFSNHSWGTAIDLYFGDGVVDQGIPLTQRGIYLIYNYFNSNGWYWGAEFSGDSVDSMHFELAEETIRKIGHLDKIKNSLIKSP